MKRMTALLMVLALSAFCLMACGGAAEDTAVESVEDSATESEVTEPVASSGYTGETVEADNFSIVVPEGWEYMEIDGGLQLYKMSGEVIEVHYRGFNQGETHAMMQVEITAENNAGSQAAEVEFLGKNFWYTEYMLNGTPQVFYACIEDGALRNGEERDGVMLSVKYAGELTDPTISFENILNTVIWK